MKPEIVYIRITAMMMVVFFHCVCFYTHQWSYGELFVPEWQFTASFLNYIDMPVFVFISGYLYAYMKIEKEKYADNRLFLKEKAKRLILPYVVWTVINICLIPSTFDITRILQGYSHLWFLMMLMMVFIIVTVTQRIWTHFRLRHFIVSIGLLAVISVIPDILKMNMRWLCINLAIRYLPYFFLGIIMVRYNLTEWFVGIKYKRLITILALLILVCVSWSNAAEWSFKGWYYLYSMLIYGAVTILLITCLLYCKIKLPPPEKKYI